MAVQEVATEVENRDGGSRGGSRDGGSRGGSRDGGSRGGSRDSRGGFKRRRI